MTAYTVLLRTAEGQQLMAQSELGAAIVWTSTPASARAMSWDDAVAFAHRARSSVCQGDIVEVCPAPGGDACPAH